MTNVDFNFHTMAALIAYSSSSVSQTEDVAMIKSKKAFALMVFLSGAVKCR